MEGSRDPNRKEEIADTYIENLQQQIYFMELELKILKEKVIEDEKSSGIGGLFAGGMPKLKSTQGGVATGRARGASNTSGAPMAPTPQNTAATTAAGNRMGGGQQPNSERNYFNNRSSSNASLNQVAGGGGGGTSSAAYSQSSLVSQNELASPPLFALEE